MAKHSNEVIFKIMTERLREELRLAWKQHRQESRGLNPEDKRRLLDQTAAHCRDLEAQIYKYRPWRIRYQAWLWLGGLGGLMLLRIYADPLTFRVIFFGLLLGWILQGILGWIEKSVETPLQDIENALWDIQRLLQANYPSKGSGPHETEGTRPQAGIARPYGWDFDKWHE